MWLWILAAVIAGVAGIAWMQHRAARGTYRSLSSRQPARHQYEKPPLGMEATDLDLVARTTRRNETYERANVTWTRQNGAKHTAAAETDIEPGPDDHTYAKWFHRSFLKNKEKT